MALGSCKNSDPQEKFLPPAIGGVNTLLVVMDTELWKGALGDTIRAYFAAPILGLPQAEPQFTITQIPPQVFKGATAHSRSVLWVAQDTTSRGYIKTDVYAKPQKVAVITGEPPKALSRQLEALAPKAITAFKTVEIEEAQHRFTRSLSQNKALEEEFEIRLNVPSLYKVGKREKNFVWMDLQIPRGTMNIIAYALPWNCLANAATFVNDVVTVRDSIGKMYIPGPYEGTFVRTEKAFSPYVFPTQMGGKKAVEVRGIWEVSGYPMAGPFVMYIIDDVENRRRLVLEGFTFAPSEAKRDYMFELEAILKTLQFNPDSALELRK